MTSGFELPPIGNEAIDCLREIQTKVNLIDDIESKRVYVVEAIREISSDDLFDQDFDVTSANVIGTLRAKDGPRRFRIAPPDGGIRFIGRAAGFNYFLKPDEFIDCLAVDFRDPVVLEPDSTAADFELFTFQVPVLAIDSFEAA